MAVCFTHVFVEPTGCSINFCNMYWLYGGYASDQVIAVTNIALWDCFGDEFYLSLLHNLIRSPIVMTTQTQSHIQPENVQ